MFGVALLATAPAQEIPRPSLSRVKEAAPSIERPYNLKLGPVTFTASAALGLEYVDNVNLTSTNPSGDLIIRPSLSVTGVWQVSRLNNLEMRTTIGYTKYIDHPELDSQTALISPDSEIRLNIFIGDVKLVLHEQFSIEEDPVTQGGVSGVAKLGRFTNTVGANALWDLNAVVWSVGYDHYNFITTGDAGNTNSSLNNDLSTLDHSTEQLSTSFFFKLSPTTNLGLEGTAGYSSYPHNSRADYTMYSFGPFLDLQLTRYTHLTLSGGYQIYQSQNGGQAANVPDVFPQSAIAGAGLPVSVPERPQTSANQSGNNDGYYANLAIVHRLNRFYQDRFSVGREFQVGLLSDRTETTFVNYASQWTFNRRLSLGTSLYFEDVQQTSQFAHSFGGATLANYKRFGVILNTSYQLTKKLNVSLRYQVVKQIADFAGQDYLQNRVGLEFGYQF